MAWEGGVPRARLQNPAHWCKREKATCELTALTSSSLSRRALASSCFSKMKVEQKALSPMGMPKMIILIFSFLEEMG